MTAHPVGQLQRLARRQPPVRFLRCVICGRRAVSLIPSHEFHDPEGGTSMISPETRVADSPLLLRRALENRHHRPRTGRSSRCRSQRHRIRPLPSYEPTASVASSIPTWSSSARPWISIPGCAPRAFTRWFASAVTPAASCSCGAPWPGCVRPRAKPFLRLQTFPAEQAQVDWAHFGHVAVGRARRALSCFVITLS